MSQLSDTQRERAVTRKTSSAITCLSATEIAQHIAAGDLSSREVVEAHIRQIEMVNPRLNAVVVTLFEQAREDAARADRAREQGNLFGPLHGVPITLKEQFMVAGTATTVGLMSQKEHRMEREGPLLTRLRQAGAIILGKTNVSQLLMYHEADNPVYGRTNNPWDLARTPGGSSGGEAAIIAAGASPLGLGATLGAVFAFPRISVACTAYSQPPGG